MTYKLTLDGTELESFKINFNVGDSEKNGTLVYDQRYWDENHNTTSTRIMMFTDKDLHMITINYYNEKGELEINEMFPYSSILSTEAIVKKIESHDKI
ncbi:MAG TPA: hypothetical protein VF220_01475 [Nitrososphaeraceae archaeon]